MSDKESITVVVRVRPPRTPDAQVCVSSGDAQGAVITTDNSAERNGKQLGFVYSGAFFWNSPEPCTNARLYEAAGRVLLNEALRGYNTSLLAYGQTVRREAIERRVGAPLTSGSLLFSSGLRAGERQDVHVLWSWRRARSCPASGQRALRETRGVACGDDLYSSALDDRNLQ